MSRCLTRISLVLVLLISSEAWAIGLGDIRLDSALNEPLRAEIELLSASPEELAGLSVTLASAETFARYGIDRPYYLQQIAFNVVSGPDGAVVQVRSPSPITEPFLTFLVEASWSAGRLLREYTVLLDPPTYSPPAVQQPPAVTAPQRVTPTDSGRIERQEPVSRPEPQPEPRPTYTPPSRPTPAPTPREEAAPVYEEAPGADASPAYEEAPPAATPYSTTTGGDYYVERGDTLWGITTRLRPDSRLTINQTMIAIFEANPQAFEGNINRLKAGASLRIPSADDVFQISRGNAFDTVKRMNEEWRSSKGLPATDYGDTADDTSVTDTGYEPSIDTGREAIAEPETETSLTLVPPDEEPADIAYDDALDTSEALTREEEVVARIAELEAAAIPDQPSLIEIRDNELASLRQELANIRGEVYEPPAAADDVLAEDEILAEDEDVFAGDQGEEAAEQPEPEEEVAEPPTPTNVVRTPRVSEPSLMDRALELLGSIWTKIIAALLVVAGILLWFVRRGRGDDDEWDTLDRDEIVEGAMTGTESLRAPTPDESFVVVEQDSGIRPLDDDTMEAPAPELPGAATIAGETGQFDSLEDTFSSETAVNLDQTDPLAEADFHMAYGLYDQAADLINGALESEPQDRTLMAKLCEIYFVWGKREEFIEAATRLKHAAGSGDSSEWDKIVIMGQQIAGDHEMFAGAGIAVAPQAVDLSFETGMDDAAELDMDFGADATGGDEIVDLGAPADGADDGLDFLFDDDDTTEAATAEMHPEEPTAEMPKPTEPTVETPTIESEFAGLEGTSELPSLDGAASTVVADPGHAPDETAEINLDELDLEVAGLDDAELDDLDATGTNEVLGDLSEITGKNPEVDPNATGVQQALDETAFGDDDAFRPDDAGFADVMGVDDPGSTGLRLAPDETGRMPTLDSLVETDTSVDADLLDATGKTQVLSDDLAVDTGVGLGARLGDDDETLLASVDDEDATTAAGDDIETVLAPLDDDEEDYDFAKTEALPPDAFISDPQADETSEMPAVAGTDMDLDLDDLTAALQVSAGGDTVEQPRDDATVEQPRPWTSDETAEVPTMALGPDEMSDDLHEARTMTEVGTKLDLARAYVDMGDPAGARSILEEVLDEGDESQRQQAQQLLDSLPS